ncbi:MAG: hypothetical protein ACYTAN_07250 [Planctomycetota bacterium]|jgi:hypothetical protein
MSRRRKCILLTAASVLLGAALLFPGWGGILSRRSMYFDLTCGRIRHTRHILGARVKDVTSETDMSRLYRKYVGNVPKPVWENVGTVDLAGTRYCNTSSVRHIADLLARELTTLNVTDEARTEVITTFFRLARNKAHRETCESYFTTVSEVLLDLDRPFDRVIRVEDLPAPPNLSE